MNSLTLVATVDKQSINIGFTILHIRFSSWFLHHIAGEVAIYMRVCSLVCFNTLSVKLIRHKIKHYNYLTIWNAQKLFLFMYVWVRVCVPFKRSYKWKDLNIFNIGYLFLCKCVCVSVFVTRVFPFILSALLQLNLDLSHYLYTQHCSVLVVYSRYLFPIWRWVTVCWSRDFFQFVERFVMFKPGSYYKNLVLIRFFFGWRLCSGRVCAWWVAHANCGWVPLSRHSWREVALIPSVKFWTPNLAWSRLRGQFCFQLCVFFV